MYQCQVLIDNIHMRRSKKTPLVGADPFPWAVAISLMEVSGHLREGSEQLMASHAKGEACCASVLKGGNDFDNYNYEKV